MQPLTGVRVFTALNQDYAKSELVVIPFIHTSYHPNTYVIRGGDYLEFFPNMGGLLDSQNVCYPNHSPKNPLKHHKITQEIPT